MKGHASTVMMNHRKSLLLGVLLSLAGLAALLWNQWPSRTANFIASSVMEKKFDAIKPYLDAVAVDDLQSHVQKLRGRKFTVNISADKRSIWQWLRGEQGFLIMGYDGAHRFNVTRGVITDFRYVFISGGFEYHR
jgi:hypothetical protein